MSSNSLDYDEYLSSIHHKLQTPEEVIREVVKKSTNHDFIAKTKIIAGEVNEVYDIKLTNNKHVILRISQQGSPNFQQEKWAIEQVKQVGIPVPKILSIQYVMINGHEHSFCLMNKVEGQPLERGNVDFSTMPNTTRKNYIVQAGGILSKIHSIKTSGYGWIADTGKSEYKSVTNLLNELEKKRSHLNQLVNTKNMEKQIIDKAFCIIDHYKTQYALLPTCLNHGDYGPKHFMIKEQQIIAILDWGGIRSDTPIMDFAAWDYWFGEYIPTNWLMEGYQNKQLFTNDFGTMIHVLRIIKGIEVIGWYYKQNFHEMVDLTLEKLKEDVIYFQ